MKVIFRNANLIFQSENKNKVIVLDKDYVDEDGATMTGKAILYPISAVVGSTVTFTLLSYEGSDITEPISAAIHLISSKDYKNSTSSDPYDVKIADGAKVYKNVPLEGIVKEQSKYVKVWLDLPNATSFEVEIKYTKSRIIR